MVDGMAIRQRLERRGYKLQFIADALGVTPQSLNNKLSNRTQFKASEISRLIPVLGVTELTDLNSLFFRD